MHLASEQCNLAIVKCLVEEGHRDPDIKDNDGYTALLYCDNNEIAEYLIRHSNEQCNATITDGSINDAKNEEIRDYLIEQQKHNQKE